MIRAAISAIAQETAAGLTIDIQAAPRSSREKIGPIVEHRLRVFLTAPPVDGEANEALIQLFSRLFRCPKRNVSILRGQTGKKKTILIAGAHYTDLERVLTSDR